MKTIGVCTFTRLAALPCVHAESGMSSEKVEALLEIIGERSMKHWDKKIQRCIVETKRKALEDQRNNTMP
jgi:hypothetical protein